MSGFMKLFDRHLAKGTELPTDEQFPADIVFPRLSVPHVFYNVLNVMLVCTTEVLHGLFHSVTCCLRCGRT
jgi:hypothetical protein